MSRERSRLEHTPMDNLVSNLRAEVGEIISTWTLLETFLAERSQQTTGDIGRDMEDQLLNAVSAICEKLSDDIIAKLSELGHQKIGRLTFYFAARKLNKLTDEVAKYKAFVEINGFVKKRNYDISHQELPEKWDDHKLLYIDHATIVRGVALAMTLMKRIDRAYLGPSAPYLWREMRKKRYQLIMPLRVKYLLLPYMRLSQKDRMKVIEEEMAEGVAVWTKMSTLVNGEKREVLVSRKWGAVLIDKQKVLVLDNYPLNELNSIETS